MNATDCELELSSESCERWGWLCGGIIVAGVVAEVVIAAVNPPYSSFWERWGTVVADALVALGVGGEIMFARIGYSRQKELSRRSDERIAELEFAGGFAEERAAQLAKDAAEARRETEQLKKEVAWREIDSRTAAKLVAELSKFPSRVTLVFISGDPETTQYCVHFRAAFVRAKWETEVVGRTYMGSPVGVFVTHGHKWNTDIQAEVDRLRSAITNAGIPIAPGDVGGEVEATKFRIATNDVKVVIGHKPAPQIE